VPTSIDLPLSTESKRVLAYAAEEAEMLNHGWIGTEHLFLGLLREESGLAATILRERGLKLESLREELARDFAKTQTHRESLPIDTMFVEALERHGLSAAKEHFVRCWNAKNEGNLEEARKELQVFLTSLMDSIQKQAPGEDVLAPIFKGFDWRQSPQQLHTGLPAEEDWTLRMLFTCLLAELLMKRLDQRKPPG
jgi:ATP-dependent Clp protease ATP-binding subunit ClpA